MKPGQLIKAVWNDGLVEIGTYLEKDLGYVILVGEDGKKIVCNPNSVKFEVINEKR